MGIEPYMVSTAVVGIVSQRLIKRLCPSCKVAYEAREKDKKVLGLNGGELKLYKPVGCNKCIKGYRGRIPVFEVMYIDHDIRRLIDTKATTDEIKETAIKNGMKTLFGSAVDLVLNGTTSLEEVLRIGYTVE